MSDSARRALAKNRREELKNRELVRAREEIERGIWPLCIGCEKRIDVRVEDGSWSDVGIGDYNHVGCGPWTSSGITEEAWRAGVRPKYIWYHENNRWSRFKAWLGFA